MLGCAALLAFAAAAHDSSAAEIQVVGGRWDRIGVIGQAGPRTDRLGSVIARLDDTDGDGVFDFAVSAPEESGTRQDCGVVRVHTGGPGTIRYELSGQRSGAAFGRALAALPDCDGDGAGDLLIGSPGYHGGLLLESAGAVYLFSGAQGHLMYRLDGLTRQESFGAAVSALADLDGDGRGEYLASAPEFTESGLAERGRVTIHAGADGGTILTVRGSTAGEHFGSALAAVDDVDGDGWPDFAVGAPGFHGSAGQGCGRISIHSSRNGSLLLAWEGDAAHQGLGTILRRIGDLDGDGFAELAAGAPDAAGPSGAATGRLLILAPALGVVSQVLVGIRAGDRFGASVDVADVAGFGQQVLIIGAPGASSARGSLAGRASAWLGSPLAEVQIFEGDQGYGEAGSAVAWLADGNGDGSLDAAVGEPAADLSGRVSLFGVQPLLTITPGAISASSGGVAIFALEFGTEHSSKPYLILASAHGEGVSTVAGLPVPLAGDALLSRSSSGSPHPALWNFSSWLSATGEAGAALRLTAGVLDPSLIGRSLHFAALVTDGSGSGRTVSRPVSLTFLP